MYDLGAGTGSPHNRQYARQDVHGLHVWALTSGKPSLTAHLVNDIEVDAERDILPAIREQLAQQFGITHVTIQCESIPCRQSTASQHFESAAQVLGQSNPGKKDEKDHHHPPGGIRIEEWLALLAGILVISWHMLRHGKEMAGEIRNRLSKVSDERALGPWMVVFVFVMLM
ncbi:cation transporter dimerization domain-containing protein [Cupriavidus sp. CP313]